LTLKEQSLSKHELSLLERTKRLQQQTLSKRDTLDSRIHKLSEEWESVEEERNQTQNKLDEYGVLIDETRQKVQK
jgi:septal ring factor EnvC (AmiA/AmiB activator)